MVRVGRQIMLICLIAFTHGGYASIQCIAFLNPCIYIICTLIRIDILKEINSGKLDGKNRKIITFNIKINLCFYIMCVCVLVNRNTVCSIYIEKRFPKLHTKFCQCNTWDVYVNTGGSMMEDFCFCFPINYILFKLCLQYY